jgi:hypothetical protein
VVCLKKMDNFAQLKQGLMEVNIDNEHADDLAKKLIAEGLKNLTKVKHLNEEDGNNQGLRSPSHSPLITSCRSTEVYQIDRCIPLPRQERIRHRSFRGYDRRFGK